MVFLVRRSILMSVFLKMFVIYEVFLTMYVNSAHFWGASLFLGWAGLGVWAKTGKPLFCKMLWIEFSSSWYSSCCRL
jgi:hypothetical protein